MRSMLRGVFLLGVLTLSTPAFCQVISPLNPVSQSDLAAVAATAISACQPAATVPPPEAVGGAAGNGSTCRLGNAVQPRITRAASCTLDASGTCSVTWATALSSTPVVILTPVNTVGLQPIICNSTAIPTVTGVSIKCWVTQTTTLSLAIVTAGLSLAPAAVAPSGTVVQITALPVTQ